METPEVPQSVLRYRVVFASDLDPDFGRKAGPGKPVRRPRPEPATCSTPAVALGLVQSFGDPNRLVVERIGTGAVLATYKIEGYDLGAFADWPHLIEQIREDRAGAAKAARKVKA
jgi:hypothetical protein